MKKIMCEDDMWKLIYQYGVAKMKIMARRRNDENRSSNTMTDNGLAYCVAIQCEAWRNDNAILSWKRR